MADITVLQFPEVTDVQPADILYLIRGTGADRDKKIQVKNISGSVSTVVDTAAVDLSIYGNDLTIFADKATPFTITFSNYLTAGKKIYIVGVGAGLVTLAGSIVDTVSQNVVKAHVSSGTEFYSITPSDLVVDSLTATNGVKTDNVFLKTKRIDIGDWDMNADDDISVAHGLSDFKKIRKINAVIRSDDDSKYYVIDTFILSGTLEGGVKGFDASDIVLGRATGGIFDFATFSSTPYNRGWITITYEV